MDPDAPSPTVRHDPQRQRYEAVLDGEVVAFAEHHAGPEGVEVFPHTVTSPSHRGRGLAAIVVQHAMDDMRAKGRKVDPACWFVAGWLRDHPDYQDVVADS